MIIVGRSFGIMTIYRMQPICKQLPGMYQEETLKKNLESFDKRKRSCMNITSEIRTRMFFFCWLSKIIADRISSIAVKMMFNSLDEETKRLPTCLFLKIVSVDLKGRPFFTGLMRFFLDHNLVWSKNNLPPPIRFKF